MPPDILDILDIYCKSCGYNLRDRRCGECSECGEQFNRKEGSGYRMTPISPATRFFANNIRLISGPFFLMFSLLYIWLYIGPTGSLFHLFLAICFSLIGFANIVIHFFRPPTYKG